MYIQKYISSNIAQNAKLPICRADPPNLKLGEDPQDLSQSRWNFHTLLIMCRDNFPSPLYIRTSKKVFSLHPTVHPVIIGIYLLRHHLTMATDLFNQLHEITWKSPTSPNILRQGRPFPQRQWCISPSFRIPPISEKFLRLRRKFSRFLLFQKFFRFSSTKISYDLFLSHRLQISKFPL